MMTLALTLTRCEPKRRRGGLRRVLGRVVLLMVLAGLAAWVLHIGGHLHLAWSKHEMRKEVAR